MAFHLAALLLLRRIPALANPNALAPSTTDHAQDPIAFPPFVDFHRTDLGIGGTRLFVVWQVTGGGTASRQDLLPKRVEGAHEFAVPIRRGGRSFAQIVKPLATASKTSQPQWFL
jgi:hypothetical protein